MPEQDRDEVLPGDEARPALWRWVLAFVGLFAGGSLIAFVIIVLLLGALLLFFFTVTSGSLWACLLGGECGRR